MEKKWWTLIAVCVGTFMLLLDVTIVVVAIPDIQDGLHASFGQIQWVIDAYALTLASLLLTAGVLADRYGRRFLFAIGVTIFTLGSLLCGLAQITADAHRLPECSGRRRGHHVRHFPGPARPELPGQGPRRGLRSLGGHHGRGRISRPHPGRRDHHRHQLAGHLPGQRAHRYRGPGHHLVAGGRVPGAPPGPPRLDRLRAPHDRTGRPGVRPDPGQRDQLGRLWGCHFSGARCHPAGRFRDRGSRRCPPDVRHQPVPGADLRRWSHRRVLYERVAVLHAPLPGALPSGHARILGSPDRSAPSADQRPDPCYRHHCRPSQ